MNASILTVNAGSSSLKCAVYGTNGTELTPLYQIKLGNLLGEAPRGELKHLTQGIKAPFSTDFNQVEPSARHEAALRQVLTWLEQQTDLPPLMAVGHRIVHGGDRFTRPVRLTAEVQQQLEKLIPLAPLHQPFNLKLVEACTAVAPQLLQVASFDTMFHASMPELERMYALPKHLRDAGIQRYGFHGLSYAFIQRQLESLGSGNLNTVICHLGAGASMCAVKHGRSIASSMGFTAVEGLPMGSRSGQIDPGVLLYLQRNFNMDADSLENLLYKESGWLGISGISSDMLTLHQAECAEAEQAIDLFCYRAALEIGRLTAALGGLEQLVFTGGVGENDADVRARIIHRCQWLGIALNEQQNTASAAIISATKSALPVRVIATNEEAMLAQYTLETLQA
ncbi:acetate/propionate family kinase [Neptuniibacter sp. CAU 1671]|uniref:acetate/propionate family kinase n=1 Tax=Neptuniibacter sp. CAU 1671 TaxID=3032593 RepID=UPI0023DCBFB4|nr:acetate/propionate family kinase [Neptuniibacter sp. CAU 1671]MDF2182269.1 acetate/propionate family kinase [Neptuniibacter sp. CAU 1671]